VVNAASSVTVGDGPWFWTAPFEIDGELWRKRMPPSFTPDTLTMHLKGGAVATAVENITLAVIVTDAVPTNVRQTDLLKCPYPSRHLRGGFLLPCLFFGGGSRPIGKARRNQPHDSHQITKGETRMLVVMINNIIARAPERAPGRLGYLWLKT